MNEQSNNQPADINIVEDAISDIAEVLSEVLDDETVEEAVEETQPDTDETASAEEDEPETEQGDSDDEPETGDGADEDEDDAVEEEEEDRFVSTPARKRLFEQGERIRNAIAARNATYQSVSQRLKENFSSVITPDYIVEQLKQNKPINLLTEYTVEQLVGESEPDGTVISQPYTNPATGLHYTREEAEAFVEARKEVNEERTREFSDYMNQELEKFQNASIAVIDEAANRAVDEHLQIEALLDEYPILDLEDPNLEPPYRDLANVFWGEIYNKYTESVFGEEVFKPNFSVREAAEKFFLANEDYLRPLLEAQIERQEEESKPKAEAKPKPDPVEEKPVKGIAVPSGKAAAAPDKVKDEGDTMAAMMAKAFGEKNKHHESKRGEDRARLTNGGLKNGGR